MKKNKFLLLITFAVLTLSCEKQAPPLQKTDYMLHCLMIEGENPKIKVWRTLQAFPEYAFDILYYAQLQYSEENEYTDFRINITGNNTVFNKFEEVVIDNEQPSFLINEVPNGNFQESYLTSDEITIKPGNTYEIQIDIFNNDYENKEVIECLKAKTTIPEKVEIGVSQLPNSIETNGAYADTNLVYEISFNDPPINNNFYYLLVYSIAPKTSDIENINLDSLWLAYGAFQSFDADKPNLNALLSNMANINIFGLEQDMPLQFVGFLFSDEQFDGLNKVIRLEMDSHQFNMSEYLFIDLLTINEEYYKYYYAIDKQNQLQEENLYTEPVQLYTNIENGLGVFAGASISRQVLKIESKP